MRIELATEGGLAFFPGLHKPVHIESSELSEPQAAELTRLLEASHFFELPATLGVPPAGAADYRTYTLTIEDAGRRHTVSFTDFAANVELAALRDFLRSTARKRSDPPPPAGGAGAG